jgi:uncharacterized protein
LMEYAKEKARQVGKKVSFSIDSNGTLLVPSIINKLKENNVFTMISIDGFEEIHNKNRYFHDKTGSYKVVIKNIQTYLKIYGNKNMAVRMTINPDTVHRMFEFIKYMHSLGILHLDFAPNYEIDWSDKSLKIFEQQIESLTDYLLAHKGTDKELIVKILERYIKLEAGIPEKLSPYGHPCGILLSLSVDGYFYPCHRFVGVESYKYASLDDPAKLVLNLKEYCGDLDNLWHEKNGEASCPANNFLLMKDRNTISPIFKKFYAEFRKGVQLGIKKNLKGFEKWKKMQN